MIKVDNMSEASDIKSEVSESYLNIKTVESLSDQEASDFVSKAFEDAHNIAEFDTYDNLLSEVFNRSEEELFIDFEFTEEIIALLQNFRPEKWDVLNDSERANLTNELSRAIGEALGLDNTPTINISECDDAYGYYDPKNNSITLNNMLLSDPIELVDTIVHELRHAYQYMRADILDTREDALYKVNFENYITPIPLPEGGWLYFMDYYNQYVEVDARAFADKFTEAML